MKAEVLQALANGDALAQIRCSRQVGCQRSVKIGQESVGDK
jgi:hypothetical protein